MDIENFIAQIIHDVWTEETVKGNPGHYHDLVSYILTAIGKTQVILGKTTYESLEVAKDNLLARVVKVEGEVKTARGLLRRVQPDDPPCLDCAVSGCCNYEECLDRKLYEDIDAYLHPKSSAAGEDDQGDADDDPGSDPPLGGLGCVENEVWTKEGIRRG